MRYRRKNSLYIHIEGALLIRQKMLTVGHQCLYVMRKVRLWNDEGQTLGQKDPESRESSDSEALPST